MKNSRRDFLKIAGVTAVGLGVKPALDVMAAGGGHKKAVAEIKKGKEALIAEHWGMVIDTRKFESAEDLEPIIEACHITHNVPDFLDESHPDYMEANKRHEIKWIWEDEFKHVFPNQHSSFLSHRVENLPFLVLCNHCENPSCVRACPTQATFKREDGIVVMDMHRCIGCRFCMAACPYGSRSFNFRDPRPFIKEQNSEYPTRMKGVVEKCNFCAERLAVGKQPACVEVSNGAIVFGDLGDPESEIRKVLAENFAIRRKVGLGTEPSVYYIV